MVNKDTAFRLLQENEEAVNEELTKGLNNLNVLILQKLPEALIQTETPVHPAVADVLLSIGSSLGYTIAIANEQSVLREGPKEDSEPQTIGFAAMRERREMEKAE